VKYIIPITLCLLCYSSFSQTVVAGHQIPSDNFYVLRDYINTHLRHTSVINHNEESSKGDHLFDRWIDYWRLRVNADGSFPEPDRDYHEMQRYRLAHPDYLRSSGTADWQQVHISYTDSAPGIGRVDRINFNPYNPSHIFLSTPSGSLWESTDAGGTWTVRTDQLPVIGLSGIIVDPLDTNVLYMSSGDGEANMDNPSLGVLKSYDGGHTWTNTGLIFNLTTTLNYISRIEMSPANHLNVLAASSQGIYQTTDSGTTWTLRAFGNFRDVKYMPGASKICYATTGTDFYRSVDSGSTWSIINYSASGTSCMDRLSIGVSPSAPANVYLLAGGLASTNCPNGGGFMGLYASNDTGKTFYLKSSSPNILGYDPQGLDAFSQSWYTLALGGLSHRYQSDLCRRGQYLGICRRWAHMELPVYWPGTCGYS
jgi:photosystem II stability/assembly factor-like uncharacterized protein